MITLNDLVTANKTIKTVNVQNKQYAEVPQRIKAFRCIQPNGAIVTEMLSNEGGVCVFKATVYDEDGRILGTGTAYEREGSTFINKTSYIENCETSAVGRALGMCGFGIDVAIASAEEVMNAIANQDKPTGGKGGSVRRSEAKKTPEPAPTPAPAPQATPFDLQGTKLKICGIATYDEGKAIFLNTPKEYQAEIREFIYAQYDILGIKYNKQP